MSKKSTLRIFAALGFCMFLVGMMERYGRATGNIAGGLLLLAICFVVWEE